MKAKKKAASKATTQQPDAPKGEVSVKIGAFPGGKISTYKLPEGSTYYDGLKKAGLNPNGNTSDQLDVRVNGQKTGDLTQAMKDGDQILLFTKVRGN